MKRRWIWAAAGLLLLAGAVAWGIVERRTTARLGAQAYLYALPLVLMDVTREETFKHPAAAHAEPNRLYTIPVLADASFRTVVRPNVDTVYSIAWLDLAREPVVLSIPAGDGRYHVAQFMDAWTNVFFAPGIRTLGRRAQRYLVAGPGWQGAVPPDTVLVRAPTTMVWMLGRIHVRGDADLRAAQIFQHRFDLRPLSRVGEPGLGPVLPDPAGRGAKRPDPMDIVRAMPPRQFFERFLALAKVNPPAPADARFVREVLTPLGLSPAAPTPWDALPRRTRRGIEAGIARTWAVLTERAAVEQERTPSGWAGLGAARRIGSYGTNYPVRAAVALFGLGANLPEDAVYLNASVDGEGRPLAGGRRYRLTFKPGALPPVRGFWSVTLYDRKGYLIDHPTRRYAVRQFDPLSYAPDGSLTLYIQPNDPGPARRANWLPSPDSGFFVLSLRSYWPEPRLLDDWMPPPVVLAE